MLHVAAHKIVQTASRLKWRKMNITRLTYRLYLRTKLYFMLRTGVEGYHPLPYQNLVENKRANGTLDRWKAINEFIGKRNPSSVLDIGCHTGFFSMEMAKAGHFCLGVDLNEKSLRVANLIKEINRIERAWFINYLITQESIAVLPHFDITFCMSVFHHWALRFGADGATLIMKKIADQTNGILVFETAQTDNCSEKYKKVLPDMGDNPKEWLASFMLDLGFKRAYSIGAFAIVDQDTLKRELMVGIK